MEEAGYSLEVITPRESAECGMCSGESPSEMVARLAYQKAADVVGRIDGGLVLAADTVAVCVGQVLGKPVDREGAEEMLWRLSGREHQVLSGVCLWRAPGGEPDVRVEMTTLRMDRLDERRMEEYLEGGGWEGKAGAFGYQDGLDWVHILDGSATNVVGLPMELVERMLEAVSC